MPKGVSAPIHAPGVVRYAAHTTNVAAQPCVSIIDVNIDASGIISRDTILDDFNSHMAGYFQDAWWGNAGETSTFQGLSWVDLNDLAGRTGFLGPAAGHPAAGAKAGPFSPPQVQILIHKNSVAARGQKQGRMYIADVRENVVDDTGVLTGGEITAQHLSWETFRTAISGYQYPGDVGAHPAAWRTVHVHKPAPLDPTTWIWSSSTITGVTVGTRVATQRDRMP